MTTLTTNFAQAPGRSRADRVSDSVVAGYIHELAATARRATTRDVSPNAAAGVPSFASAQGDDVQPEITVSRAGDDAGMSRRNPCWSRGGRLMRPMRLQHASETR